jgi:hypothetical protein
VESMPGVLTNFKIRALGWCGNWKGQRVSRESGEEDLGAAGVLRSTYSAGPVSQTCSTYKARAATRCNPQVWLYETFIVSASSSSA